MRLLLDARPLQGMTAQRGVGSYVRQLARGLVALEQDVLLLHDARGGPLLAPPDGAEAYPVSAPPGPATLWGRWLGPRWLGGARADVWHATFLAPPRVPDGLPWIATIHDVIPLRHPWAFSARQLAVFRRSLRDCARARRVVAVSAFTAGIVAEAFGVPRSRIRVIPPPVDVASLGTAGAPVRDGGAYLLHLGGFDPLKGVDDLLLPAFAAIAEAQPELRLVLTGGAGRGLQRARAAAERLGVAARCEFVGYLGEAECAAAIRGARAVVVASREEGFGIPAVQALAAGVPLAVGPAEATREIAPEVACQAAGAGHDDLAAAMEEALAQEGPESPVGEARRAAVRDYAPESVAARMLEVYSEVVIA